MNKFKGHVYILFSLLVLIAAAVLVIGNLGTRCKDLWVYSQVYNDVSVGGLMLASAGGGMVTVKANGAREIVSVEIKPEAIDSADPEMLEDLVVAAVNEALRAADRMLQAKLGGLMGGLGLPGM